MKILLLGYMGCGKSTVGRFLAQNLHWPFVDLDELIAKKEGLAVAELIREKGELYFRKKEAAYYNDLLNADSDMVIALGGGTPVYANNHLRWAEPGIVSVYLRANLSTLVDRLENEKGDRPLLDQKEDLTEFIAKHLFERAPIYNLAQHTIAVDGKTPDGIAQEIAHLLR